MALVRVQIRPGDRAKIEAIRTVMPKLERAVNKVLREEAKVFKSYMNIPASNWKQEHKPRWSTKSSGTTNRISVDLVTRSTPYIFIWGGTRVRYRLMSHDWVSKTKPGTLLAGAGRGKPLGFGVAPGIEARNWHEKVFDIRESIFNRKMRTAIGRSLRSVFPHGGGVIFG